MQEKACYQKLDEPVLVWLGLEFREVAASIGSGAAVAILSGILAGLGFAGIVAGVGVGLGLIALFRSLRSGGPGYVFARLYRLGVLEWLPAGIRPIQLLSLQRHSTGRFRWSPVEGEPSKEEIRDRRRYFGR